MKKTRHPAGSEFRTDTRAILESISDGVFTVDAEWRITSFNRAAEQITGIDRTDAIGRLCQDVFRSSMCEADCALRKTLETGKPVINRSGFIIDATGRRIPISVSTAVLRDESGTVIGGAETFRDLGEVETLRKELEGRFRLGDLVSRSSAMRKIFDSVPAVAASASTLLIHGETGTGKELLARAIHEVGPRAGRPFVAVNCGALPDTLLESELFGYRKGAFTGADRDRPGRFEVAGDGTLFLDEIGEISQAMQVRLLRVLQERQFEPLGSNKPVAMNARIVAATHRDLAESVRTGSFRQDLFYRIHVVPVEIPPLRRRIEDIPLLVQHFVEKFNRIQNRNIEGATPECLELLMAHDWPGNVRELENVVERAFVLGDSNRIESKHLPREIAGILPADSVPPQKDIASVRRESERHTILAALRKNEGSRIGAAKTLGIHKTTLYRKMNSLGIGKASEKNVRK
jgi:PAS domain S-box-containing protein